MLLTKTPASNFTEKSPFTNSKGKWMISIVVLALVLSATYLFVRTQSNQAQHCVASGAEMVNSATGEIIQDSQPAEMVCFDTFVEAINYGTGNRFNFPPDASQEEIAETLRNDTGGNSP